MGRPKKTDSNTTNYKRGFNAENYERLYPWAKKGRKFFYSLAAKRTGADSLNEFIINAIEDKMQREAPEIYADMIKQTGGENGCND